MPNWSRNGDVHLVDRRLCLAKMGDLGVISMTWLALPWPNNPLLFLDCFSPDWSLTVTYVRCIEPFVLPTPPWHEYP
jgi:hypothetical protein